MAGSVPAPSPTSLVWVAKQKLRLISTMNLSVASGLLSLTPAWRVEGMNECFN
jgi:hypothetical protein